MHGKSFQERFRSKPENAAKEAAEPIAAAAPAGKGWRRICTVVPRAWELRLLGANRISTYRLAHELLYLHWYGKGKPVSVSSKVAKAAKLSVRSKWNALNELKQLGLIKMDCEPGKSPRAILLHTRTPQT